MTIAADTLPQPGLVEDLSEQVRRVTPSYAQTINVARPDLDLEPRRWLLSWPQTHAATAAAIREHHRQHRFAVWQFKLPRTGETVFVQWASGPRISWESAVSASVTAEVRETLAHE